MTRGLRTGWTTGTCASAAAKAAAVALTTGTAPAEIAVGLPSGQRVSFLVEVEGPATCVVVKDAGDDPDCTDGARITATASRPDPAYLCDPTEQAGPADRAGRLNPAAPAHRSGGNGGAGAGPVLLAGPGVGTITLPGLGLAVGAPAINPVPRRMVTAALAEVTDVPLVVTFSVPGGEAMATKTTNARLGIVGGISILGTTGIVRPFSTAAYRASVVQQVDVAAAQGETHMVLATGSRSERAAQRLLPGTAAVGLVEVGDFTGICLRRVAQRRMPRATFVGMAGKITKLAAGVMMTHFRRSVVDTSILAEVAAEASAPPAVVAAASETETARHFFEVCLAAGALEPLSLLCRRAASACERHVGGQVLVDVIMVDFEGQALVATSHCPTDHG